MRIQQKGQKVRTRHFLLAYLPRTRRLLDLSNSAGSNLGADLSNSEDKSKVGLDESRIGVTITKKIDKRAARRNRLRRRIRELFRLRRPYFVQVADLVVIALGGATELEFDEVRREMNTLLYRAKLLPAPRSQKKNK